MFQCDYIPFETQFEEHCVDLRLYGSCQGCSLSLRQVRQAGAALLMNSMLTSVLHDKERPASKESSIQDHQFVVNSVQSHIFFGSHLLEILTCSAGPCFVEEFAYLQGRAAE